MYTIAGSEFIEIVQRGFVEDYNSCNKIGVFGRSDALFDFNTAHIRNNRFDIFRLRGNFYHDIKVRELRDFTHISLHFHISGYSDAAISGITGNMSMQGGNYNIFNCVNPVSSFIFPRQQNYEYVCIGLNKDYLMDQLTSFSFPVYHILNSLEKQIPFAFYRSSRLYKPHFNILLQEIINSPIADTLKEAYQLTKINELLLFLLNEQKQPALKDYFNNTDSQRLYALKQYLDDQFLNNHSLESLSRDFLLNEFKLKAGFKKLFKQTVFGYIHQLRMNYAMKLLHEAAYPVNEVATLVGYSSASSFIRAFIKTFGYSPGRAKL